jgi:hypothetical protein
MTDLIKEKYYFDLRKEGKIYVSKLFKYTGSDEALRNVHIVFEHSDQATFGKIEGGVQLRVSPRGKQQVCAVVSQDTKKISRLTLSYFREKQGEYSQIEKDSFTLRAEEYKRLSEFLTAIEFIDFGNPENFQIEDMSGSAHRKAIVDKSDADLISSVSKLSPQERKQFLTALGARLSPEDVSLLLGRRQALSEFETQLREANWTEKQWQKFFEQNFWIFGYGLDYRIMKLFDREMTVGAGGTANQDKPIVDYLATFTDYTVLVEIKTPDTAIFKNSQNNRAGTATFSAEFIAAVSQVLEQKSAWLSFSQGAAVHRNRDGNKKLEQRTRDTKTILVVGNKTQFSREMNDRESDIRLGTFELFRRENRNVEIVTFDELLERARYIQSNQA